MGEYIKHPGTDEEIKIGVLDHCFFSKNELLEFKKRGFKGFYAGQFDVDAGRDDSLKIMIETPNTLFSLPKDCPFDPNVHTVRVSNERLEHDKVYLWQKGNVGNGYQYILECKQKAEKEINAVMIGERYDENGKVRSIFKCDCCGKMFSIDKDMAEKLKTEHPYWAQWINPNPKA